MPTQSNPSLLRSNQDGKDYWQDRLRRTIYRNITDERIRQNVKWCNGSRTGVQRHNIDRWNLILGEERGEVEQAILDVDYAGNKDVDARMAHLREELIQVAAVAVAILERIDEADVALLEPEGKYPNEQ